MLRRNRRSDNSAVPRFADAIIIALIRHYCTAAQIAEAVGDDGKGNPGSAWPRRRQPADALGVGLGQRARTSRVRPSRAPLPSGIAMVDATQWRCNTSSPRTVLSPSSREARAAGWSLELTAPGEVRTPRRALSRRPGAEERTLGLAMSSPVHGSRYSSVSLARRTSAAPLFCPIYVGVNRCDRMVPARVFRVIGGGHSCERRGKPFPPARRCQYHGLLACHLVELHERYREAQRRGT